MRATVVTDDNHIFKFADDTYLIIPATNSSTSDLEIGHIRSWAASKTAKVIVEVLAADFLLKELSIFGMAWLQQSTFHLYPALRALSVVLTFQNL